MSKTPETPAATPPDLAKLFQRYLAQQVNAETTGLGFADVAGDVLPYEAAPAQPVEPRLAWNETLLVLQHFGADAKVNTPPEWPNLVALHASCADLSFSAGHYPQLVRNLQPLLQAAKLSELRGRDRRPLDLPALAEWSRQAANKGEFPELPLAVGLLRASGQLEAARDLMTQKHNVPAAWQAAWCNEEAALRWALGDAEAAAELWRQQSDNVAVSFNRGMAALFVDRPGEACGPLNEAVRQLPERSGWHHLARLYLAMAEMRSA